MCETSVVGAAEWDPSTHLYVGAGEFPHSYETRRLFLFIWICSTFSHSFLAYFASRHEASLVVFKLGMNECPRGSPFALSLVSKPQIGNTFHVEKIWGAVEKAKVLLSQPETNAKGKSAGRLVHAGGRRNMAKSHIFLQLSRFEAYFRVVELA